MKDNPLEHIYKEFHEKDIDELFADADKMTDAGNPEGYTMLAEAYCLQNDFDNATLAYEKGIEHGCASSMYGLAILCYEGLVDNTRYDWYDAERFMEMCSKTDSEEATDAKFWLGEYFLESTEGDDPEFGVDYLLEAATEGHPNAYEVLAGYYYNLAEHADFKNEELNSLLFKYQEEAYGLNPHEQSLNYGILFSQGIGTPKNMRLALKLFEEDYEFGHHEGAEALASHYREAGDIKEAEYWEERALKSKQKKLEQEN